MASLRGSCQRPRPLTDEGEVFGAVPQTGSRRTLAPHPACGHLPKGEAQSGQLRHTCPHPGAGRLPSKGKAFAYDKKGVTQLNTEKAYFP